MKVLVSEAKNSLSTSALSAGEVAIDLSFLLRELMLSLVFKRDLA